MYKDGNGNWKVSGDANADWAQCIAVRNEELQYGEYCPEASMMAMALLAKKINRDIKTISTVTRVPMTTFDEDYREEILLLVLAKLPKYEPATGPFVTMIYNDMQQLLFKFKNAPYSGGGGAPSYYQAQNNETGTMSVEAMQFSANMKNNGESDFSFELIDEKVDIEQNFIEKEEAEGINIVRKCYPFKDGCKNSLYNAAAFAKLLGGYAALPNAIKNELHNIWNSATDNATVSQSENLETDGEQSEVTTGLFDSEPVFG